MRILLACLLTFAIFFTFKSNIFAHAGHGFNEVSEDQIAQALEKTPIRYLPGDFLYRAITVKEFFSRVLKPSAAKRAEFDMILSGKRLKEAYLLLLKGDVENSSEALDNYASQIKKMLYQLEKARSQNQDINNLLAEIADTLSHHEVLIIAAHRKYESFPQQQDFNKNLEASITAFRETVRGIDGMKPGIRNRFQILEDDNGALPLPGPEASPESTPSTKPKKIIY